MENFVFVKTDVEVEMEADCDAELSRSPSPPPTSTPVSLLAIDRTGKRGVGRLVDTTQADDRRMIHLVRDRHLLYARSNLPVASYQAQVKKLWREVADIMGWTGELMVDPLPRGARAERRLPFVTDAHPLSHVADVRRKWSHIRNSYSRHLRNEIHGVRTGKGRQVSRWYLADELEFLREHMATDTRASPMTPYSLTPYSNPFLKLEIQEGVSESEPKVGGGVAPWYAPPEASVAGSEDSEREEDSEAYFQFFRGIYKDYRVLAARQQRAFRRQCLIYLHELLDAAESAPVPAPAPAPAPAAAHPVDLSRDTDPDSCPD